MKFLKSWLNSMFPERRLMPGEGDVKRLQLAYRQVFGTPQGRELIELWFEQIVLTNPRSTDPNECIKFAAQCAFVEDIVKALDRAENQSKYDRLEAPLPAPNTNPRMVA